MDIKIHCKCGQRYRFEVEPVEGRMPASVICPACGADGTKEANTFIQMATALGFDRRKQSGETERLDIPPKVRR